MDEIRQLQKPSIYINDTHQEITSNWVANGEVGILKYTQGYQEALGLLSEYTLVFSGGHHSVPMLLTSLGSATYIQLIALQSSFLF